MVDGEKNQAVTGLGPEKLLQELVHMFRARRRYFNCLPKADQNI